jgi:lysophospholipase L1-like esterase
MKSMFSRLFKVVCTVALGAALYACGSSKTVDPFSPNRVIGLGDAYNDVGLASGAPFTVHGTATVQTVVEQVAALFGVGSTGAPVDHNTYTSGLPATGVFSYAMGDSLISGTGAADASLTEQVDRVLADVGTFTDKDLIIITAGTRDIKGNLDAVTTVAALTGQVRRLLDANAKHVLIMQPLDIAYTPFGRTAGTYAGKTVTFVNEELTQLQALVRGGGYAKNPVIFTNATGLSSSFNTYTYTTTYGQFTTSTQAAYCTHGTKATDLKGCAISDGDGTTYTTTLFADNLNLTPIGNQWVASFLYNATASGWR